MKKIYPVLIEQDENGMFVGEVPTLPGCYTQGESIEEVLKLLEEEVIPLCEEHMQAKKSKGLPRVQFHQLELEHA